MHQGLGLTPGPSASLELPAEASATKVSKPVLFILKMTDFQRAHKRDSRVEQAGKRGPLNSATTRKKGASGLRRRPPTRLFRLKSSLLGLTRQSIPLALRLAQSRRHGRLD